MTARKDRSLLLPLSPIGQDRELGDILGIDRGPGYELWLALMEDLRAAGLVRFAIDVRANLVVFPTRTEVQ